MVSGKRREAPGTTPGPLYAAPAFWWGASSGGGAHFSTVTPTFGSCGCMTGGNPIHLSARPHPNSAHFRCAPITPSARRGGPASRRGRLSSNIQPTGTRRYSSPRVLFFAMEIESKQDQVGATLPCAQAEALLVTTDGLTIILALEMIRITATTEAACGGPASRRQRISRFYPRRSCGFGESRRCRAPGSLGVSARAQPRTRKTRARQARRRNSPRHAGELTSIVR